MNRSTNTANQPEMKYHIISGADCILEPIKALPKKVCYSINFVTSATAKFALMMGAVPMPSRRRMEARPVRDSRVRAILESNLFHTLYCLLSGLSCLLPIGLRVPSNFEKSALRDSLSSSPQFTYTCVASIALVIPLYFDILLDFIYGSTHASSSGQSKKLKNSSITFTFLNVPERLLILMGMTILPLVAFLPSDTQNLALIYMCCNKCQQNLMGGSIVLSLSRYNKEFWSVKSTLLSLVVFSFGLIGTAFLDNDYLAESPPRPSIATIDRFAFFCIVIPCLVFIFNSSRWLIVVYCRAHTWKKVLMCTSKTQLSPETQPTMNGSQVSDHTFYPMVYTLFGMTLVVLLCTIYGTSGRYEDYSKNDLIQANIPFLVFIAAISTLSMRMVKSEVVQGLYALIDSKKSYVRYISHELRTPLNSAFLGLKLLTDELKTSNDPKDMDRSDILADVNLACRTTLDILNDLLCFDKMESGILVVHKLEVPVLSFITDCLSMFSPQAREGGVNMLFTNFTDTVGSDNISSSLMDGDTIFIDRFKMDQVLRNLLSNALKFTPRGGSVTVTSTFIPDETKLDLLPGVKLSSVSREAGPLGNSRSHPIKKSFSSYFHQDPCRIYSSMDANQEHPISISGRLMIVVKDTGTGMLETDYRRLFKEIVQFNPEVLQAGGGSGLGLWITKGIVDLHQGQISVYSEGLGCGSSFTVELPMERNIHIPTPAIQLSGSGESALSGEYLAPSLLLSQRYDDRLQSDITRRRAFAPLKPLHHILIVDDSPLNRKMLKRTFQLDGHNCDEAEDGLIAVAKVKEMMSSRAKAYSAILMDFVMPNMDGPTATKEIRSLGYTAPIFGVTGNTLDSDVSYFIQSGADRVLAKPFDIDIFNSAMTDTS